MKKKWILLFLLGLTNMNIFIFAQPSDRRRAEFEQLKEKRIAFISKAMELNGEEAKAFWPLYNELQEKKIDLNQQLRKALFEFIKSEKEGKSHTENEYKDIVNITAQFKNKDIALDEEYITKFSKVISYAKIFRYQQAEQQFARQILDQRRNRAEEKH